MTRTQARAFGLFLILSISVSLDVLAARPVIGAPAIAEPEISASAIEWRTFIDYDTLIVTVSGPAGFTLSKKFEAGQPAMLRIQDLAARIPADGQYTWELRAVPKVAAETRRRLAAARAADDEETAGRIRAEAGLDHDIVRSGPFTIEGGAFVTGRSDEAGVRPPADAAAKSLHPAPQDAVTADDAIIQGSLCVGLDCVVNESFGFDTIRLKENNTRIKFDDTSTSSGFPANDWQLTANDSASGGASKFSIDDTTHNTTPFTIRASAPNNSIFVDSTGRLGLRTATPVLDLHITTSNTPAIRQEQTSGGGFTAQTWDIGANEANWFVRDVTGGSRLPFRIRPGAPTSSIDIAASGKVGIGTASPAEKLDVRGSAADVNTLATFGTGSTANALNIGYAGAIGRGVGFLSAVGDASTVAPNPSLRFFTGLAMRMIIDYQGFIGLGGLTTPTRPIEHSNGAYLSAGGVWTNASSRDLKEDICNLDPRQAASALRALTPVTYVYRAAPKEHHVGFIAEDSPDLVTSENHRGMSAMDVVAVLTRVVQDQQKTIAELSRRIEQLEKGGSAPPHAAAAKH